MKALVTGGCGFLGSRIVRLLVDRGDDVLILDRDVPGEQLPPNVEFLFGDMRDQAATDEAATWSPEQVFHLAAEHYVPWCREHPGETLETNAVGTLNLIRSCEARAPEATFVLASSAAVYGFGGNPFSEADRFNPVDAYGVSKVLAEGALRNSRLRGVAARLFNLVGGGDPWPHIVPKLVAMATQLSMRGDIPVGNLWPRRDYVHVQDAAEALLWVAEEPEPIWKVNIGTGIGTDVATLADMLGVSVHPTDAHARQDDGDLVADVSKASVLGWSAKRTLADALAEAKESA